MAAERTHLPQEVTDVAWQSVELVKAAFDDMQTAKGKLTILEQVDNLQIPSVVVGDEAYPAVQAEIETAQEHFNSINTVFAPDFHALGETNPFSFVPKAEQNVEGSLQLGKAAIESVLPVERFKTRLANFLNPEAPMDPVEQLAVSMELWNNLGYDMPSLSAEQQKKLAAVAEANPSKRIVAAPLLSLNERKAVCEVARKFTNGQFSDQREALWTPDESYTYGKLLRDPTATVKDGRESFGLRYKSPENGKPLTRAKFEAVLLKTGQGVAADSGTTWVVSLIDAGVETPRSRDSVGELYAAVNPIIVPEIEMTTQLFHLANGTPNKNYHVNVTNEAVYKVYKNGRAVAPVRVAGVGWGVNARQTDLGYWGVGGRGDAVGARGGESGL